MKVRSIKTTLLSIIIFSGIIYGQIPYHKVDSILKAASSSGADSTKARLFDKLAEIYSSSKPDSAENFIAKVRLHGERAGIKKYAPLSDYRKAVSFYNLGKDSLAKQLFDALPSRFDSVSSDLNIEKGNCFFYLAMICADNGKYVKAEKNYLQAALFYERGAGKKQLGSTYNNLGLTYVNRDINDKALNSFLRSLKYRQQTGDLRGQAFTLGNIGIVYQNTNQFRKAINIQNEVIVISEKAGSESSRLTAYNSIGICYYNLKMLDSAEYYYKLTLNQIPDGLYKSLRARALNNLGIVYEEKTNFPLALEFFNKSILLKKEINDQDGIVGSLINIANVKHKQGNEKDAEKFFLEANDIAKDMAGLDRQRDIALGLHEVYYKTGKYKDAADWHVIFSELHDSIFGERNNKVIAEMSEQFDADRRDQENLMLRHQTEKKQLEIEKGNSQRFYLIILSSFAGLIALTLLWAFNGKRKVNRLLTRQKAQIEFQNEEITASINYARKIQESILPNESELRDLLPGIFVLYLPKDIVAGDFFWVKKRESPGQSFFNSTSEKTDNSTSRILLAAADCTGHGVPGAFMSLIGKENLDKASQLSPHPSEILFHLNRFIKNTLKQNENKEGMRDGMDIALCAIEKTGNTKFNISYSGANRPLWLVKHESNTITELKANKTAIGGFTASDQEFEEHQLQAEKNDCIYLFSDGYADQFGGPRQKKFTTRQLRNLLLEISSLQPDQQKEKLHQHLQKWKGATEQIDDILILGIKF